MEKRGLPVSRSAEWPGSAPDLGELLSAPVRSTLVPSLGHVSSLVSAPFHELQSESFFKTQGNGKIANDIENVSKLMKKFNLSVI